MCQEYWNLCPHIPQQTVAFRYSLIDTCTIFQYLFRISEWGTEKKYFIIFLNLLIEIILRRFICFKRQLFLQIILTTFVDILFLVYWFEFFAISNINNINKMTKNCILTLQSPFFENML